MEFIKTFPYIIQYKRGKENIIANALSSLRYTLLSTLNVRLLGFDYIKKSYINDDFSVVYNACDKIAFGKFYKLDTILKKNNCIYPTVICVNY